jgi:urease accessory protein
MTRQDTRQLTVAAAAGLGLSLLSALPAGAHGLATGGLASGASHPLLGLDHLLLLLGVGAAAALTSTSVLLVALGAAVLGSLFGSFGGNLPGAEVLAALTVSALGFTLLARHRRKPQTGEPLAGHSLLAVVLATGVAIHAMLHGQEASGTTTALLGWWIGAGLASSAVVGMSFLALRQLGPIWGLRLAGALGLAGGALALAPLV